MSGVDPINYDVGELRDLAEEDQPTDPDEGEGSSPDEIGASGSGSLDEWNWGFDTVESSEGTSADDGGHAQPDIAPEMTEYEPGPSPPGPEAGGSSADPSREESGDPGEDPESDPSDVDPGNRTDRSGTDRLEVTATGEVASGASESNEDPVGETSGASDEDPVDETSGSSDDVQVDDTEAILKDVQDRLAQLREQRVDSGDPGSPTPTDSTSGGAGEGEEKPASKGEGPADLGDAGSSNGGPVGPAGVDAAPADDGKPSLVEDDWPPWGDDGDRIVGGESREGGAAPGGAEPGDEDDPDDGSGRSSLSAAVAATLDERIDDGRAFDTDALDLGEKPYLGYVPRDAEDLVAAWLDFLLAKGGTDGAVRAIDGYRSTGWITVGVTVDLRSRVEDREHVPGDFDDLDRADHYRSLGYIDKITNY